MWCFFPGYDCRFLFALRVCDFEIEKTMDQLRSLKLFYAGSSVVLRFSANITRTDLLAGVCDAIGVAVLSPLRFRDGDGNIVLPSAELPSGLELHVAVEFGFAPAVEVARLSSTVAPVSAVDALDLPWVRWARMHETLKCVDKELCSFVTQSKNSADPFYALTGAVPASGLHYAVLDTWRIEDSTETAGRHCCVLVGAVDANIASLPGSHTFMGDDFLIPLMAVGLGPQKCYTNHTGGGTPMRVGFLIGNATPFASHLFFSDRT